MSIASGLINRPNQCAAEIVDEMINEAVKCLASSADMLKLAAASNGCYA
jgi:hypothetical protein